jgi:hypothetical protein
MSGEGMNDDCVHNLAQSLRTNWYSNSPDRETSQATQVRSQPVFNFQLLWQSQIALLHLRSIPFGLVGRFVDPKVDICFDEHRKRTTYQRERKDSSAIIKIP